MANKIEIRKYLENMERIAINELVAKQKEEKELAYNEFFAKHSTEIKSIKKKLITVSGEFDKMVESMLSTDEATFEDYYSGSPACLFNKITGSISIDNMTSYINLPIIEKLDNKYEKMKREAKNEYSRLIELTKRMSAKESIEYLEKLGFDLKNIQSIKEVTALTLDIDVRKLFIKNEH